MNENQLIPYENKRAKSNLGKSLLKGIVILLLAVGSVFLALNFKALTSEFPNIDTDSQNTSSNLPIDTDLNTDSSTQDTPNDTIPNGMLPIIEKNFTFEEIRNETDITIEAMDFAPIKASQIYKSYGNEAPVVLIVHKSSQEAYSNGIYYSMSDTFHSSSYNVGDIGKIICDTLNSSGVNAIHLNEIYANGGRFSSTAEYEEAIKEALAAYPSIEYVFSISRDNLINEDFSMTKPIVSLNGASLAQMKITVGACDDKEQLEKNLSLAVMLATSKANLAYDVVLSQFNLSQKLSPCALDIDIGAFSNSFEEASSLAIAFAYEFSLLISE